MSRCRSCGQPVLWARTTNGKRIPLDPGVREGGNIDLVAGQAVVHGAVSTVRRYVSHFATCPQAEAWRR